MNRLVRTLFETQEFPLYSVADLSNIEPNANTRYALVKRAMRDGDLVQLKRGLYTLGDALRKRALPREAVANRLYFPSYVSLEHALSFHGWIPERVESVTCVTSGNSASFNTPIGMFNYARVPQRMFFCGVRAEKTDGFAFLLADPLKALADYVYVRDVDWHDSRPLVESLRIDEDELEGLISDDFDAIQGNYRTAPRVEKFLAGLREDLKL